MPKDKMKSLETQVYAKLIKPEIKTEGQEDTMAFGETIIISVAIPGCCMLTFFLSFVQKVYCRI